MYLPSWREYTFAAGETHVSGCLDGPSPSHWLCSQALSDTISEVLCYAGALQHPSDLSFSAAQPAHPLHSESFGCSACDSLELHSVLAWSPCSVIHAELSSTAPSGNNQGFDLVGLFVCSNVLMYQTLSCLLPNLRWLGISGCFQKQWVCPGKHNLT